MNGHPSSGGPQLLQSAIDAAQDHGFSGDAWEAENAAFFWGHDPAGLQSRSRVDDFTVGTGEDIFRNSLLPALEAANSHVTLVTCFWAKSASRDLLSQSLRRLSDKALQRSDDAKISVHLGFSSRSLMQKLQHTADPAGFTYPPSTWASLLGLPPPSELVGLDMTVKSLFFRPFSVMHPKFLIVDGQRLWMPSCNVSWESWFEGCISLRGSVVQQAMRFSQQTWHFPSAPSKPTTVGGESAISHAGTRRVIIGKEASGTLLPSQHHATISQSLPIGRKMCPATPLNIALLQLFASARTSIDLVTPNLTCSHVVDALIKALVRGVDVSITTNTTMMIVEQLVTSLSVTELWIWRVIRRYRALQGQKLANDRQPNASDPALLEDARAVVDLGQLEVHYFAPRPSHATAANGNVVKSHVKCIIVDDSIVVLGSGNMDRASWFTSQELGIALQDPQTVQSIKHLVKGGLQGQTRQHFPTP